MREFLKSTRFKILLGFLAFLVGVMVFAVTKGGYSVSGASFINTLTKPFRKVTNGISMRIEHTLDKISNATEYYNENQRLKQQVGELNKQLTEYEALKAENEELRKFVVIKEQNPDYVISQPCDILGYVTNDPFKSFTIDKGSADGIKPYCPVATAEGLVGITIEVSEHVSTVRTILSPDLSIAAVCSKSESTDYGIVEGSIAESTEGMTRLIHVELDNDLKEGDLMVTTGTSGLFPKDYSIGTIRGVYLDGNGLSAYAELQPCVDIGKLSSVVVITDFNGKREKDDEN